MRRLYQTMMPRLVLKAVLLSFGQGLSSPAQSAGVSPGDCPQYLQFVLKSEKQLNAERLIADHLSERPFFAGRAFPVLRVVYEDPHVSVFRAKSADPGKPDEIYKTLSLAEALNDQQAFRVLRDEAENTSGGVRILDSTVLTPREGEPMSLSTTVLQKTAAVDGRTLFEVLADPGVDPARKARLRSRFEKWLREMGALLNDRGYRLVIRDSGPAFFAKNRNDSFSEQPLMLEAKKPWRALIEGDFFELDAYRSLERLSRGSIFNLLSIDHCTFIHLKSDNIMVDARDELILFDPN